jgi:hypothetical protein
VEAASSLMVVRAMSTIKAGARGWARIGRRRGVGRAVRGGLMGKRGGLSSVRIGTRPITADRAPGPAAFASRPPTPTANRRPPPTHDTARPSRCVDRSRRATRAAPVAGSRGRAGQADPPGGGRHDGR